MAELNLTPEEMEQLAKFLVELREENDFHGTHVNQANLEKFQRASALASILAMRLGVAVIVNAPTNTLKAASFELIVDADEENLMSIGVSDDNKVLFNEILSLSDEFDIETDEDDKGAKLILSFFVDVFEK